MSPSGASFAGSAAKSNSYAVLDFDGVEVFRHLLGGWHDCDVA